MKKSLVYLLLVLLGLILPGCGSKKDTGSDGLISHDGAAWTNVSVPVRFELLEPQSVAFSGRMTMVRDEYVYVSLRMLGFEVAQLYVTPQEADVVVKQVNKMWIQESVGERFARLNLPFTTLQEALLGQERAVSRLPQGLNLTVGGTEATPVMTLKLDFHGKPLLGRMTVSLSEARWNAPTPAGFSEPGPEYKKYSLKDLDKAFK